MAKFFLPLAHDASQENRLYADLREFLCKEYGAVLTDSRIFRLDYRDGSNEYRAEVGTHHPVSGELVDAILQDATSGTYYLCTRKHGVVRGHPIFVDAANAESAELFED